MSNEEIVIEIDKVTSGKNNVISFERKGKQIDQPPLRLKANSVSSKYKYHHHFDQADLARLQNQYPSIYPNRYESGIDDWAAVMKTAFRKLIESGQLDRAYRLDGRDVEVKYVWITENKH
ncbi:hypothetical protein [Sporosarcina sp.]|uniref:hypothetical protein n=1 Tax=Sporosarcina sp. TaxID=49982 RepID=UPI0026220D1E|nr:hypothetical protein [Sporosarcina sp.]